MIAMRRLLLRSLPRLAGAWQVAPAAAASPTLDRIKQKGSITFAYRDGAAPFSFKDRGGRVRGYSVELCVRAALAVQRELQLKELKIEWVPVDAGDPFPKRSLAARSTRSAVHRRSRSRG